jgi:Gpi18-like mannosyltransferase
MRLLKSIGITSLLFALAALVISVVIAWCRFVNMVLLPKSSPGVQLIVVLLPSLIALFVLLTAAIYREFFKPEKETAHGR